MIKPDHPERSITPQRKLVRLSRFAFLDTPVGLDVAAMKEIDPLFPEHPVFGSGQTAACLRRAGIIAGCHRGGRLMAKPRVTFATQIPGWAADRGQQVTRSATIMMLTDAGGRIGSQVSGLGDRFCAADPE